MAGPILVKDEEKVMQLFRQLFGKWARNSRCYLHLTESSEDAAMERPSVCRITARRYLQVETHANCKEIDAVNE